MSLLDSTYTAIKRLNHLPNGPYVPGDSFSGSEFSDETQARKYIANGLVDIAPEQGGASTPVWVEADGADVFGAALDVAQDTTPAIATSDFGTPGEAYTALGNGDPEDLLWNSLGAIVQVNVDDADGRGSVHLKGCDAAGDRTGCGEVVADRNGVQLHGVVTLDQGIAVPGDVAISGGGVTLVTPDLAHVYRLTIDNGGAIVLTMVS